MDDVFLLPLIILGLHLGVTLQEEVCSVLWMHRSHWVSLKQDSSSADYAVIGGVQCSEQAAQFASEELCERVSAALCWLI